MTDSTKISIALACDGAGVELKNYLLEQLRDNYNVINLGTDGNEPVDYPDYAKKVVDSILNGGSTYGILVCGTGIGMSMAANRHRGIRAALCHSSFEARLTREHNDANIICLGARIIAKECALENVKVFLTTDFASGRHLRRIKKMDEK